jgi:hypothetical protein
MPKNMNKILKQAQKMQAQLMKAQEEIAQETVEGTAGGGMVTVVMNGSMEIQSVSLKPEVVDPDDIEMLEDLIVAAAKNAQEKAKELSDSKMGGLTAGLNIPGLM